VGFLVGFSVCGLCKKPGVFWPNCINPEDNYGRLLDFVNQMSKLSHFNVHNLAEFMMHL